ncbi:ABC transporter permease subunit [Vibrio sp.]|nr:ABC transporter permease subunit [Vibrio sp.]
MPQIRFTLKSSDRIRLLKDRFARYAVTAGGVSVLGALILIFVYLLWVVIPLFSEASLKVENWRLSLPSEHPVFLTLDEYGQHSFLIDESGKTAFVVLKHETNKSELILKSLPFEPEQWFKPVVGNWALALTKQREAVMIAPDYHYVQNGDQKIFSPKIQKVKLPRQLSYLIADAKKVSFSVQNDRLALALYSKDNHIYWISQPINRLSDGLLRVMALPNTIQDAEQLLLTPNGDRLFIRESDNELIVAAHKDHKAFIQSVVKLNRNEDQTIQNMTLLPGASSLLTVDNHGEVSQWFEILNNGQHELTYIRRFELGKDLDLILPNMYSKGFFAFFNSGTVQSYFTTSEKLVLFERAYRFGPQLAAISKNERRLVTVGKGFMQVADVDLGYPEISFSALWNKVWYENYSQPDYVWQSTSANDTFEPKFSLVPIAFGTIKAAAFAMLFSVPIAVLAAIYTAYFMTPKMRRVVKPTIELMEALPTVIIGFLAGLWFAPIVERHLVSTVLMVIGLPLSTIVAGALWRLLPKSYNRWSRRGWHSLLLLPFLAFVMAILLPLSFDIEQWLFGGDIRVFLADYGFNFDQRNALVVGLAMGFAVIPTIFTIAEDAVFSVPKHLSDGSMALGATQWQTLSHLIIHTASPGIFSAIMMGLGRAVGETMIVLMATGNTPIMDWNILEGMRTLAATIAVELPESEVGSSHYRILFLAALILFIFTFAVNSLAEWIRLRLREKYRAL